MHIHLLFSSQWLTNRRVRDVERDAEHPIDWALVLTAVLEHCVYPSHQNEKGNDQRNDKPQEHRLSRRLQIAPTPKTVWLKAHVGIVTEPLRHSVNEHCQKTKRHDLGGERYIKKKEKLFWNLCFSRCTQQTLQIFYIVVIVVVFLLKRLIESCREPHAESYDKTVGLRTRSAHFFFF